MSKPHVIIFGWSICCLSSQFGISLIKLYSNYPHIGGLNHLTPAIVHLLVPSLPAEPLVNSIRIFDKYQVVPATTYIGGPFKKLLDERRDIVEYRQVNLTNPCMFLDRPSISHSSNLIMTSLCPLLQSLLFVAVVQTCLAEQPPSAAASTYIYDLTGDTTYDRPAEVHVQHSFRVPLSIAQTTLKQPHFQSGPAKLKAYIRLLHPYYDHGDADKKDFKGWTEEDADGWKCMSTRGVWWHEMGRAVGNLEGYVAWC